MLKNIKKIQLFNFGTNTNNVAIDSVSFRDFFRKILPVFAIH